MVIQSTLRSILILVAFTACVTSSFTFQSIGAVSDPSSHCNHRSASQIYSSPLGNIRGGGGELPRTGWMHNQPTERLDSKAAAETKAQEEEEEPRTGWLHNKKSPTKKKEGTEQPKKESSAQKLLRIAKQKEMTNHRIISSPTFHPCGEGRQVVITEHRMDVPLSHDSPNNTEKISLYFTIVEEVKSEEDYTFFQTLTFNDGKDVRKQRNRADLYLQHANLKDASEMIIYLQGGPGFGAPTPVSGIGLSKSSSWIDSALTSGFKRVVLMDQRGTGRSTPITKQTLEIKFPGLFALDEASSSHPLLGSVAEELGAWRQQAPDLTANVEGTIGQAVEYMSQFRADSIVKDAEALKLALLIPEDIDSNKPRPWGAALGQSFGGFCLMTYLSIIPSPPKICLFTGGIAPMLTPVDDVYSSLWERVKERNLKYYERYPGDVDVVKNIVKRLENDPPQLPSGGYLTAQRFLQLGLGLGGSPSSFASLHSLLNSAFVSDDSDILSRAFLKHFDSAQSFDDCPIYFLLHESIYADGTKHSNPTEWSAHRILETQKKVSRVFSHDYTSQLDSDALPTMFYGEMVFPWMAEGAYAELSGFGMRILSEALALKSDWGPLYNAQNMRDTLGSRLSTAAAAVYYDDMYVDFDACMKVCKRGGPLEKCKVWITNDYQHSGLRDDGATIFKKLLGIAKGNVNTPS